jgi:hypothetical protein
MILAGSHYRLKTLLEEVHDGNLTQNDIANYRKKMVGSVVNLAAYETGEFSGIPHNLPEGVIAWQDSGFGFSSSLVVLKYLE